MKNLQHNRTTECSESNSKSMGKFIAINTFKNKRFQISHLSLLLDELGRTEQTTYKASRRKEKMKLGVEINKVENGKQ